MPIEATAPWWVGVIVTPVVLGVIGGIGYVFKFFTAQAARTTDSFITFLTAQLAENTKERQARDVAYRTEREEWLKKLVEHTEYSKEHVVDHRNLEYAVKELVEQNRTTQALILEWINNNKKEVR